MLLKKMLRTLRQYKAQFISMALMIMLGVGVFVGFNMEWYSLQVNVGEHLQSTGFSDYRIFARTAVSGSMSPDDLFTEADLEAVRALDGVKAAARYLSVNTTVPDSGDIIALTVTDDIAVSGFTLISGAPYDETDPDGMWLSDKYADHNGVSVGDTLTLTYSGHEVSGVVRGLIKSGEYMICLPDETQMMPDYDTCGYAYVSPAMLDRVKETMLRPYAAFFALTGKRIEDIDLYFQINVQSDLDKKAFTEAVDEALQKTPLILSREENICWAEAQGEIEEGQTMGSILPVLFLAIAVLTMVTTMHRITASEKTQIGTLMALGYHDRQILRHYACYALLVGLCGTIPGIGLGYLLGWYIMNPNSAMGTYIDMPSWRLSMPWPYWLVLVLINVFLTLIGYLSVRKMISGTAADALRPYTPGTMRHLKVEETRAFKRLGFGTKWNMRDCLRHKARSMMTLLGVSGCVILILGGLGMSDTLDGFIDVFYDQAINYSQRVNLSVSGEGDNAAAIALCESLEGDWCASTSVQVGDDAVGLEIYHVSRDHLRFIGGDMAVTPLQDDGAYICERMARDYGLSVGDTLSFSPFGGGETYTVPVRGVLRMLSESVVMTDAAAQAFGVPYTVNTIFTDRADIPSDGMIQNVQTKKSIMDSFDTFMELMYVMVTLLVGGAVLLGLVVLYNLGTMSYVERYREMATLKVLGFKDRKIGRLLISQNLWLTVLGIVVGIPAGIGVLKYLLTALASEYELSLIVSLRSYLFTVLLTLGVSLGVGLMIARKNRSIDMVAALKTEE